MAFQYDFKFKVQWGDTDAAGIVFFPNFYKWMNESTHEIFAAIGFPVSKLIAEDKIGLPLLETHCNFRSPLYYEDKVVLHSTVEDVGNKVIRVNHQFYKDGQLVAEGYDVRAWTSFKEKPKAEVIPEEVRKKLLASELTVEG